MKSFRKKWPPMNADERRSKIGKLSAFIRVHPRLFILLFIASTSLALRADLSELLQNVDSSSRLQSVFFRNVTLPSGLVPVRRPPKETRADLTKLINAAPSDAELVSLRALEDEQQLDFATAEADWKKYVDLAQDKGAARLALADYYHRRLQPKDEFAALTLAAREPTPAAEQQLPASQQRPWKTYARLIALVDEQNLDINQGATQYGLWLLRYAKEPSVYQGSFAYTIAAQAVRPIHGRHRRLSKGISARRRMARSRPSRASLQGRHTRPGNGRTRSRLQPFVAPRADQEIFRCAPRQ